MVLKQFSGLTEAHGKMFRLQNKLLNSVKREVERCCCAEDPGFPSVGEKSIQVFKNVMAGRAGWGNFYIRIHHIPTYKLVV